MSKTTQSGQLLMLGFDGLAPSSRIRRLIRQAGIGGVFLFGPNIESRAQVSSLVKALQAESPDTPLLIAIDEEGGRVQDWGPPHFEAIPPAARLGEQVAATGDAGPVRTLAARVGRELREIGVNVDFAPVLDVHTNPANPIIGDRSFGTSVETVSKAGVAFMQGLHDAGVLACGKHFPGHGDTDLDSHRTLPVVSHDISRIESVELEPFRRAFAAGLQTIMTAHVVYPAIDAAAPATISPAVVGNLLRRKLGFDGLVFTDDMKMAGIRQNRDLPEAALLAVQAGCDLVLSCTEFDAHDELVVGIEKAVAKGEISPQRLAESLRRVQHIKSVWLSR